MLMTDSTAASNKWCMLANFLGGVVLFAPWFTLYKVKGHLIQFVKQTYKIIGIMKRKRDTNKLELGKGVGLRSKIYIHII